MAKRKERGIGFISSLPWPVGVVIGLIAYFGIRYGIDWLLASSTHPMTIAMGKQALNGIYAPLAWLALGASWLGALLSYIGQRQRRRLLDTQTGLDSLSAMDWRQFEMLVGEAFRCQGYSVQETGLRGADGGIDLVIKKAGAVTLVQCKQWRSRQVNVNVVREMYGLMVHHGATAVMIVAIGSYTEDARRFAQGKPIELIHGDALLTMVRAVQNSEAVPRKVTPIARKSDSVAKPPHRPAITSSPTPTLDPSERSEPGAMQPTEPAPICPRCGEAMIGRSNKRTMERFWGCSKFPKCMGTRPA